MRIKILFFLLLALVTYVILQCWYVDRSSFYRKIEILTENKDLCTIDCAIEDYYRLYDEVPNNQQELIKFIADWDIYLINLAALIDPFSKESELLLYVPFLNRQTGKLDSYVLLSAGIDGYVDFDLMKQSNSDSDSIIDDSLFYQLSDDLSNSKYNLWSRLFGKRDLLVSKNIFSSLEINN